jgi:arylsulfatase A-like enzyme
MGRGRVARTRQEFQFAVVASLLLLAGCEPGFDSARETPALPVRADESLPVLEDDPGDLLARPVGVTRRFAPIRIDPTTSDAQRYLVSGFSGPDSTGRYQWFWSNGSSSHLVFNLAEPRPIRFSFAAFPYLPHGDQQQFVHIRVNSAFVESILIEPVETEYEVVLPEGALRAGANEIELRYGWTAVPAQVQPGSEDNRELAIAYTHIDLASADPLSPPPRRVVLGDDAATRGLLIERAEELTWLVWPPQHAELDLGWVAIGDNSRLEKTLPFRIEVDQDDGSSVLYEGVVSRLNTIARKRLPLPMEESQAVRIRLIVGDLPADVRWAWVEPRIEAPTEQMTDPATVPPETPAETNLLVILLDAATRKHFGIYGGSATTTPSIDALSAESLVFDAAFANGSYTLAAMGSLFTSRLPTEHGLLEATDRVAPGLPTLAGTLADAGYDTAAFSGNPYVSMKFGLARGFDEVFELFLPERWNEGFVARADEFYTPVADWIHDKRERPFFAFVHYVQPHEPYNAGSPELYELDTRYKGSITGSQGQMIEVFNGQIRLETDDVQRIRQLYTGNLRYADRAVGRLLDMLRAEDLLERTIVVVTADHGESLGERGTFGHGHTVDAELISIPLVMRLPGILNRHERVSDRVAGIDLMPTLVETLGVAVPEGARGVNFLDTPADERSGWPRSVGTVAGGRIGIVSVIAGSFKYSDDPKSNRERLMGLPDQEDGANLRWDNPVTFAYLASEANRLRATRATPAYPHVTAVPEETIDALRALGYLDEKH